MSLYLGDTLIAGSTLELGKPLNIGQIIQSALPLTDAGLHLLDGAKILGGGIYNSFVDYIADLYSTLPKTSNVIKFGSLTDTDGVLSGFSSSNYSTLPDSFNPSSSTWEIKFKVTTGVIDGTYQNILTTTHGTTNASRYGLRLGISSDNKFYFDLGTSSSSWVTINTTYTPISNTIYYLKYTFDGSVYKLGISTDNTTYTEFSTNNSTPTLPSVITYIGTWTNYNNGWDYFKGSIDLKESYININGSRWWSGVLPGCFTDEVTWQQSITNYGVCGKFVYDSVNNTVRLPKVTGIVEGTTDLTALGDLVEAGLPNITGNFGMNANSSADGAFLESGSNGVRVGGSNATDSNVSFDASRSNPIYGNSTTVQPQTIKVLYYIVIATEIKTDIEVDIDEIATDLNGKVDTASLTEVYPVIETYSSGASWYRVYSDGWCEQGTNVTATSGTWTFLKPFKDTDYSAQISIYRSSSTSAGYNYHMFYTTKSTTEIGYINADSSLCMLTACGYIS